MQADGDHRHAFCYGRLFSSLYVWLLVLYTRPVRSPVVNRDRLCRILDFVLHI